MWKLVVTGIVGMALLIASASAIATHSTTESCFWSTHSCVKGNVLGFDTRNSGSYPSIGLFANGVSGQQKSLRVFRTGQGWLGWWYSSQSRHEVNFGATYEHQHWCGNASGTVQSMSCGWLYPPA